MLKHFLNKIIIFNDSIDYNKFLLKHIFYTIRSIIYHPIQQFSQSICLKGNRHRDMFSNNLLLKNIYVSFKTTRNNCFANCRNLQYVHIVDSKTVPADAFKNCIKLKKVFINKNVSKIEYNAFNGCTNLETVYISKNVKCIQSDAFLNCVNLKNIFFF